MSLQNITVDSTRLNDNSHRLDAKYFFVHDKFSELEKRGLYKSKTLEDLGADISSGGYVENYVSQAEGVPYFRVGNIKPYSLDEQVSSLVFVRKDDASRISVESGDVVLGRTQAVVEKLGVASIIDQSNGGSAISQHVTRIRLNQADISPDYLVAYLNSKFYKLQTALATHGDTRVELTHAQLKQVRILLPEKSIVEKIEKKSDQITRLNRESLDLISEAQRIIKLEIGELPQPNDRFFSIDSSSLFNFGIWNAKSHLPLYVETENAIRSRFNTKKLNELASIGKGVEVGSENYTTDLFRQPGSYAFIRTSDITNNDIDIYPDYFVSPFVAEVATKGIEKDEILFSKDGIIGEIAIPSTSDKVIVASGFARIQINPLGSKLGVTPEYLFAVLSNGETGLWPALRRTVTASTIPHLRESRLGEVEIPLLEERTIKIVTELVSRAFRAKNTKKILMREVEDVFDQLYVV